MSQFRIDGQYQRMVAAARRVRPALSMSDASLLADIPVTEPNRLRQAMVDVLVRGLDAGTAETESPPRQSGWDAYVGRFSSSEPDLARRAKEIVRAEMGQ